MKNLFNLLIVLCTLSIIGCNTKTETTNKSEKQIEITKRIFPDAMVNLTSPDNAIKTYWKIQIFNDTTEKIDTTYFYLFSTDAKAKRIQKTNKAQSELKASNFRVANKIDKVEMETDSRAKVWAIEYTYPECKDPDVLKYTLVKVANKWLIESIDVKCSLCKGTGIWYDEKCKFCDATGWNDRM